jgi:amino acid transporter
MNLPRTLNNWTSLIGAVIASVSFFLILFLIAVSLFIEVTSTYLGLVIYIILPIFLVTGLVLIPIGMAGKRRRMRKSGDTSRGRWPEINLNLKQHRTAFSIFILTSVLFIFLSAVGTYEAFHYTESTEFC